VIEIVCLIYIKQKRKQIMTDKLFKPVIILYLFSYISLLHNVQMCVIVICETQVVLLRFF